MNKSIIIQSQGNFDVEIVQCGWEQCANGHFFGPAVRDYYLIHYVVSGQGIYKINDTIYNLKENDGFLISPQQLTFYQASEQNPWEYIWVGFKGAKAKELLNLAGLGEGKVVFSDGGVKNLFIDMKQCAQKQAREIIILSKFYAFIAHLAQNTANEQMYIKDVRQHYAQQTMQYIHNNYMNKISVAEIADQIRLNRSYLFETFKKQTKLSPQQYLIWYRMNRACHLLRTTDFKIGDVARSVGYDDEFMFTRMFKRKNGMSPSMYRKTYLERAE